MATFRQLLVNTLVTGVTSTFLWFAPHVLGVPGDPLGGGHRRDRRRLRHRVARPSARLRHLRRPPPQARRRWCWPPRSSRRCASALAAIVFVAVDTDDLLQLDAARGSGSSSPPPWSARVAGHDAQHRPVDLRHAARARGPPRPGQRHGRHGHRRLVRDHLGVQRPRDRQPRHGVGALRQRGAHRRLRCSTCRRSTSTSPSPSGVAGESVPKVDVRGAIDAIRAVPGLGMLIALAAFNNLLAGVFMALMDAYGLELVSVETWGFLWGVHQPRLHRRRPGRRPPSGSAPVPLRLIILGQPRELDGVLDVRAPLVDRAAGDRDVRVAAADAGDRGGRADRAAAVDPLRAAGPRVRLRPAGGERGRAGHRVPDRPARRDARDALHDRRPRRRLPSATGSAPARSAAWR